MSQSVAGKTAVVVGGSSGMGRAVAEDLLGAGADVVITSRTPESSEGAKVVEAAGGRVVKADMTTSDGLDGLVDAVEQVDYVVLTAAALRYKPFRDFPVDEAREAVGGKLFGYWNVVHRLAPVLTERASIVLFSGIAAWRPKEDNAAVTVANAGLVGLMRALALELAPVRVNVISPGVTDTPSRAWMDPADKAALFEQIAGRLPAGRVGQVEDMAHAVRFLLTNPHVTGSVVQVDGGTLLV